MANPSTPIEFVDRKGNVYNSFKTRAAAKKFLKNGIMLCDGCEQNNLRVMLSLVNQGAVKIQDTDDRLRIRVTWEDGEVTSENRYRVFYS